MGSGELLDAKALDQACKVVWESPDCVRTPLLKNIEKLGFVDVPEGVQVHLKLENMQLTGSFKSRGVASQMAQAPEEIVSGKKQLVTISAGNYGKTFAYFCKSRGIQGNVIMPITAPDSRQTLIEKIGCKVLRVPTADLMMKVNQLVKEEGMTFLHPFDDVSIIAGYGSVGAEIVDEVKPDVVLVCCGGGGLLSGVAASIRLLGYNECKIYGVEPETANTMQLSLQSGEAASLSTAHSVAAGLAPPFAGKICYKHASKFADGVITLSDSEIAAATKVLYQRGLLVEPSGAAAFGAVMFGKVPDLRGTVVAVVTGGNATPSEMAEMFEQFAL
uniref:L-serine ammonia-lyase n=1 Tax=Phallusia mammillata TaxID=59560 RepID=A0A6F9DTS7_9ASCI|nr:serine racemase-like [Phallusia mammillata]